MAKKLIRLTEGDLHNIIKESVNKVLFESFDEYWDEYDEFDRNGDVNDVAPGWIEQQNRLHRFATGKATKQDIQFALDNPYDMVSYDEHDFDYQRMKEFYPKLFKQIENKISWNDIKNIYKIDNNKEKYTLGVYRKDGQTCSNTARIASALRGHYYNGVNSRDYFDFDKNQLHGNVKNDMNLNVYDSNPSGLHGMLAQSNEPEENVVGKSIRSTMRDTFNAARNKKY